MDILKNRATIIFILLVVLVACVGAADSRSYESSSYEVVEAS